MKTILMNIRDAGACAWCGAFFQLLTSICSAQQVPRQATAFVPSSTGGISAEAQYRPGFLNPWKYPLIEVYLRNGCGQPVEWKRAFFADREVKDQSDGIVWHQFYPSAKAAAGQTIMLQICLTNAHETDQILRIETQDGQHVKLKLEPFPRSPEFIRQRPQGLPKGMTMSADLSHLPFTIPRSQILGITFSSDFLKVFVTFSRNPHSVPPQERNKSPTRVEINGKDFTSAMVVRELPAEKQPGMLTIKLPEPAVLGRPIHVRMQFADGDVTQCLLRAWKGIFLDDFGVKEGADGEKLRRELGLDVRPAWQMIPADPACGDDNAKEHGKCVPSVLETRQKWYKSDDDRPCYPYLCTASVQET